MGIQPRFPDALVIPSAASLLFPDAGFPTRPSLQQWGPSLHRLRKQVPPVLTLEVLSFVLLSDGVSSSHHFAFSELVWIFLTCVIFHIHYCYCGEIDTRLPRNHS